jgi:hypothetical protein
MSDDRPQGPPEEQPSERVHDLAEEIREELHELAEHVPPPVRWTVRKLIMLAALSLVGLLLVGVLTAILYVANRTEWAAGEIELLANRALAGRTDLRLRLPDVKGSLVTGVRLIAPRLEWRNGGARTPFLEAREVRLAYTPMGLLRRDRGPIEVRIIEPKLHVERDAEGRLRWPRWKSGPRRLPGAGTTRLKIAVQDASAWLGGPDAQIRDLDAEGSAALGKASRIEVRSLTWSEGPMRTRSGKLAGSVEITDSARFEIRQLSTDRIRRITARGSLAGKGGLSGEAWLEVHRLQFTWLAEAFRNGAFDVPGEFGGRFHVRGGPIWRCEFVSDGRWKDLPVEVQGQLAYEKGRVLVRPLRGRSPAGDLDGELAWRPEEWSVGGVVARGRPEKWAVLGLAGWPTGDVEGRFVYRVNTRRKPADAEVLAWTTPSTLSGWRVDSARVRVTLPAGKADSFQVAARRRGGDFRLEGKMVAGGWLGRFEVDGLPLEEWPDGRALDLGGNVAQGRGTLDGRGGRLAVEGELHGQPASMTGMTAAHWSIDSLRGILQPEPYLQGNARLRDLFFMGVHLDSTTSSFHLAGESLHAPDLRAWAGDSLFATAATVTWGPEGWGLDAERLTATSSQFAWSAEEPVRLAGDEAGVRFERFVLRDLEARLQLSGRWAGPRGSHDFSAEVRSLDLARAGLDPTWGVVGQAEGVLRVWGASDAPRWALLAGVRAPGLRGHLSDSLRVNASGGAGIVSVQESFLWLESGRIALHGRAEGMEPPWPDTLTADGIRRWIASARGWEGSLRTDAFPLERLERLVPAARGVAGELTGELAWSGRPANPSMRMDAQVDSPTWESLSAERFRGGARLDEGRLHITRCELTRGQSVSVVTGSIPLQISLSENRVWIPEEPLDLHADLVNGDLGILPLVVPQVGYASGGFTLRATLGGTAERPDLAGRGRVRGARVRLSGREETLQDVALDLTLDESRITVDSLGARQGERGVIRARGAIELEGLRMRNYRFDAQLRQFRAQETGVYVAEINGDFVIQRGPTRAGVTLPFVTGRAQLERAVVLFDFANQSEVQQMAASTRALGWVYSIRVEALNGLRWRPPDADIEFSAELQVEQTLDSLLIFGELRAIRGDYFFLSNRFRINRAVLTFDNLEGVDPQLDIEATTDLPRQDFVTSGGGLEPSEEGGTVSVVVAITGRASRPNIVFTGAGGGYDEAAVLRALGYEQFSEGRRITQGVENYLTRVLSRELSQELSAAFGGYAGDWELSRDASGQLLLGVGTQLTPELRVRYQQAVWGYSRVGPAATRQDVFERDVEAEYRLSRFVYLTTGIARRRVALPTPGEGTASTDFNVNLRVRYEY